jgi:hypothetical protein
MECFCKEESFDLKLEADFVPDPVWCSKCGCNIDTDDIPLLNELKSEIRLWLNNYNKLLNNQIKSENLFRFYQQHNSQGVMLAQKIQSELGDKYKVEYYPS